MEYASSADRKTQMFFPRAPSPLLSLRKALLTLFGISIGVMAGILGVLTIIWFIGWLIGRIRFGRKNPEPPTVSMNNVDTYIEAYREKKARKEQERLQRKKRTEAKTGREETSNRTGESGEKPYRRKKTGRNRNSKRYAGSDFGRTCRKT